MLWQLWFPFVVLSEKNVKYQQNRAELARVKKEYRFRRLVQRGPSRLRGNLVKDNENVIFSKVNRVLLARNAIVYK